MVADLAKAAHFLCIYIAFCTSGTEMARAIKDFVRDMVGLYEDIEALHLPVWFTVLVLVYDVFSRRARIYCFRFTWFSYI